MSTAAPRTSQAPQIDWWQHQAAPRLSTAEGKAHDEPTEGRLAFAALLAFTAVLVLAPQEFFPPLRRLRLAFVFAIVAIAAHLLGRHKRSSTYKPVELKIVTAVVALAVLGIPTSYWRAGSVATLTDQYLKSVAIFWLLGAVVSSVSRLRWLLWTLVFSSVPLALVVIHNYISGAVVGDRVIGYNSGLASNPNDLALTLNLLIPLTLMLAITCSRTSGSFFAWAAAGISVIAVLMTLSRGGFLTLLTESVLLCALFFRLDKTRALWALGFLAVSALAGLPNGYAQRVATIFDIQSDPTGSAQARWSDSVEAVRFIAAHPLTGAGIGQGMLALNEARGALWLQVHNAYLNYAVDLGIAGLALFLALIAASYHSARRIERLPPDVVGTELKAFAGGIRISLSGFIVAAFFHPVPYHFYFYYIAGLSVALNTTAARQFGIEWRSR